MMQSNNEYIESLYQEHFTEIRVYAEAIVGNRQMAEEIAQDVFHIASIKIPEVQDAKPPIKWLLRVAKNVSRNYLRRRERYYARIVSIEDAVAAELFAVDNFEDTVIDEADHGSDLDAVQAFEARLHKILSEDQFFIYHHLIVRQKNHSEIASRLGISVWACQKQWQRARGKIHDEFYGKK